MLWLAADWLLIGCWLGGKTGTSLSMAEGLAVNSSLLSSSQSYRVPAETQWASNQPWGRGQEVPRPLQQLFKRLTLAKGQGQVHPHLQSHQLLRASERYKLCSLSFTAIITLLLQSAQYTFRFYFSTMPMACSVSVILKKNLIQCEDITFTKKTSFLLVSSAEFQRWACQTPQVPHKVLIISNTFPKTSFIPLQFIVGRHWNLTRLLLLRFS